MSAMVMYSMRTILSPILTHNKDAYWDAGTLPYLDGTEKAQPPPVATETGGGPDLPTATDQATQEATLAPAASPQTSAPASSQSSNTGASTTPAPTPETVASTPATSAPPGQTSAAQSTATEVSDALERNY